MPSDAEILIQIGPLHNRPAALCIDGHITAQLTASEKIIVRKVSQPLCLIHAKDFDFLSTARQKLQWESS